VLAPNNKFKDLFTPGDAAPTFVGQSVTITMIRGGVIAGRVISASGDPVIGVAVKAVRVRDEAGRQTNDSAGTFQPERTTDDRGVYRIYGLAPGSYIASAGGRSQGFSIRPSPYAGRMATYYPSVVRDTAVEVKVTSGDEVLGIDIRYRGERGFAISGNVSGAPAQAQGGLRIETTIVWLRNPVTGVVLATAVQMPIGEQKGYAFYGVPKGEYEVVATREEIEGENGMTSPPRRVIVNDRDLSAIDLALAPHASIAGAVAIEKQAPDAKKCKSNRDSSVEEIVVKARRDEPGEKRELVLPTLGGASAVGVPGEKGAFAIRNLKPGRYRIEIQLPDDGWFLKAMTMLPASTANDPRTGLAVRVGERITGLNLTVATGAASLKGKLAAPENTKLPARVRIYLLPAEAESKDNLLRFAEAQAENNGGFSFANLAPGKYLMVARAVPHAEPSDEPARPVIWNPVERVKLRKEAEAANVVIELEGCQRVGNFVLWFPR
jgi:hypothetical protein